MNRALFTGAIFTAMMLSSTSIAQTLFLSAIQDSTLYDNNPTQNQGFSPQLQLGASAGISRIAIQFNLSTLEGIRAEDIEQASIQLRVQQNSSNWPENSLIDSALLLNDWSESSITWACNDTDCQQSWQGGLANNQSNSTLINNEESNKLILDVTADMTMLLDNSEAYFGWLIKKQQEQATGGIDFYSRQGSLHPSLVIKLKDTVDLSAPTLTLLEPTSAIYQTLPQIKIHYQDDVSGVDTSSLQVQLNGEDILESCEISATVADCTLANELAQGYYTISTSVSDLTGKTQQIQQDFQYLAEQTPPASHWVQGSQVVSTTALVGIGTDNPQAALEVHGQIIVQNPTKAEHAATKDYVDSGLNQLDAQLSLAIVNDKDQSINNELQQLTVNAEGIHLSHNGGSVSIDDADADPNNEIQNLNNVLSINNDAQQQRITNVANPIANQDVATKNYVDHQVQSNSNQQPGIARDILVGGHPDTTTYACVEYDLQALCADGDGCRIRVNAQHETNDGVYTNESLLYLEGSLSNNRSAGIHGYTYSLGYNNHRYSFVLDISNRYTLFIDYPYGYSYGYNYYPSQCNTSKPKNIAFRGSDKYKMVFRATPSYKVQIIISDY